MPKVTTVTNGACHPPSTTMTHLKLAVSATKKKSIAFKSLQTLAATSKCHSLLSVFLNSLDQFFQRLLMIILVLVAAHVVFLSGTKIPTDNR